MIRVRTHVNRTQFSMDTGDVVSIAVCGETTSHDDEGKLAVDVDSRGMPLHCYRLGF